MSHDFIRIQITSPFACHLMKSYRERTARSSFGKIDVDNSFHVINGLLKGIKFNAGH
jgi:hypothetical protein